MFLQALHTEEFHMPIYLLEGHSILSLTQFQEPYNLIKTENVNIFNFFKSNYKIVSLEDKFAEIEIKDWKNKKIVGIIDHNF